MKLPHFPFYPSDFLGSPTVMGMTLEERGAYITLLCCMWQTDDCALPLTIGLLSRLLIVPPDSPIIERVLVAFEVIENGGKITHSRLRNEHKKAAELYSKRVKNTAKARKEKEKKRRLSIALSIDDTMPTIDRGKPEPEPEPEPEPKKKKDKVRNAPAYSDSFLVFWKVHPYGSKKKAFEQFRKMNGELPDIAADILREQVEYAAGSTRTDFRTPVPHLYRWFRDRRWEDERPVDSFDAWKAPQ